MEYTHTNADQYSPKGTWLALADMSGQLFLWNTTTGLKCPNIPWTHTLLIGLFVGSGVGLIVGGFDGVFVGGFDGLFVGVFVVGLFVGEREGKLSIRFSVGEIDGIFSWVIRG